MKNRYKYSSEVVSDIFKDGIEDVNSTIQKFKYGIVEESYFIKNEKQSNYYNKPIGQYKLVSIPNVLYLYLEEINYIKKIISSTFQSVIGKIKKSDKILIVGLGNRHISSDSLGTKVVSMINVNIDDGKKAKVMAFCPSVLGLTGIKTYDTISGVVDKVKPTHLILIDSLCAGSVDRLGTSIQISNTGICPGSGIGNKQKCIDKNLAPNVFSVGVPLLIYASTFIRQAFNDKNIDESVIKSIMQRLKNIPKENETYRFLNSIKEIYNDDIDDVIVTIKDIEECTKILSEIISYAINECI